MRLRAARRPGVENRAECQRCDRLCDERTDPTHGAHCDDQVRVPARIPHARPILDHVQLRRVDHVGEDLVGEVPLLGRHRRRGRAQPIGETVDRRSVDGRGG
jgi:hypothetical protein